MSTVTLNPSDDSFISDTYPATTHGGLGYLYFGYSGRWLGASGEGLCKTWIKFDLSQIPAGATINSATFSFLPVWGVTYPGLALYAIKRLVDAIWSESTLTWNNAPVCTESLTATIDPGGHPSYNIDVTSDVQNSLSFGAVTWQLTGDYPPYIGGVATSKDYGSGSPPQLVIDYTPAAPSTPTVTRITPVQINIDAGDAKTTIDPDDEMLLADSAASLIGKKMTWLAFKQSLLEAVVVDRAVGTSLVDRTLGNLFYVR